MRATVLRQPKVWPRPLSGMVGRLAGSRLSGLLLVVLLLAFWELSATAQWLPAASWPRLSRILLTWADLLVRGEIPLHLANSLKRMAIGYFIAVLSGVSIGVLMGYFRPVYNLLEPITEMIRPLPSPAYVPVVMIFLGIEDQMKIFLIVLACFFPILVNTMNGVRNVDPVLLDTGRTLGLSTSKILRKILLPAATPYIFTGARISLALALILMVFSEMVAANSGIGFFILYSQRTFKVAQMYSGVLTLALVGYLFNRLFVTLENRLMAWNLGYTRAGGL